MTHLDDIIGLRYAPRGTNPATGVDCLYTARRALERIFPDLRPEELPLLPAEESAAIEAARSSAGPWTRIGGNVFAAQRAGDLLFGAHAEGEPFVAVLVDSEKREVITATRERGSHILPIRKLLGVTDVFRRVT